MHTTETAEKTLTRIATQFSESDKMPSYIANILIKCPEVPCDKWSDGNQLAMQMTASGVQYTSDARGYNQWQKVGRYVKKGSKARYILIPKFFKQEDPNNPDKPKMVLNGFCCTAVFAVEDTDGRPLPEYTPKQVPPLADLAQIEYKSSPNGKTEGYYTPGTNTITLCSEAPEVFLHELMHLYDGKTHQLKGAQDKTQEIVAELGACVLCELFNVQYNSGNVMRYIANYAKTKDPIQVGRECLKVSERVMTAIRLILKDAATTTDTTS